MANIKFKRGLQADLPAVVEDGVFYLTTDTNRLYVGQPVSGSNTVERKLLNQTVQIIGSLAELTAMANSWTNKDSHVNDFYYITDDNVLAVYTGVDKNKNGGWVQINPDTNTTTKSIDVSASSSTTNDVTMTVTSTDTNDTEKSDSIHFTGEGTAHVSVDADGNIKITGDSYSLSAPTVTNDKKTATVTLTDSDGVAAHNSTLILESGDLNTLTLDNSGNKIVFNSHNTNLDGANAKVELSANNGSVTVGVTDSDSNKKSATLDKVGVVLNDGTYAPLTTAGSTASAGALYSKAEIDSLLNGLDGMTYKGTIGNSSSGATLTALPTVNVKNGDTYVIISNGLTSANFTGATFETATQTELAKGTNIGDMFIAKGTESNGAIGDDLTWTYIPSGNDSAAEYTYKAVVDAANNIIEIQNENDSTVSKLALVAGTNIALSSARGSYNGRDNNVLTTTINHATITTSNPAPVANLSNGASSFTAIKELTINNGHVTAITTDTFTPVTYDLQNAESTKIADNDINLAIKLKDSNDTQKTSSIFNLHSSSLKITPDSTGSNRIGIDLEWGTF